MGCCCSSDCVITAEKVLSWINVVQMVALGIYTIYWQFADEELRHQYTRTVLACYLVAFGIITGFVMAGVDCIKKNLEFLTKWGGRGAFFMLCGSLGLAFGFETKPLFKIAPFILGCFSFFCGIWSLITSCVAVRVDNEEAAKRKATEETPLAREQGPSRI